jgi:hypothetical protein
MSITEVRKVLLPQNPFILGKHSSRPAPQHVLNGFIARSIGISDRGVEIRHLISDGPMPSGFRFVDEANWKNDPAKVSSLRNDLKHVFDPDHRTWKDFGSPVIVHALLANSDPSDQNFGPLIWELMKKFVTSEYEDNLKALFMPGTVRDPLTACAMILVEGTSLERVRAGASRTANWYSDSTNVAGALLGGRLSKFLQRLTRPIEGPKRLFQIQHLERGLYLTAILSLMLGPLTYVAGEDVESVDGIGSMVVWADSPPGRMGHPMVSASVRSLQLLIEKGRVALSSSLANALAAQPLPSGLPENQKLRFALAGQLGLPAAEANETIDRLCEDAKVSSDALPGDRTWSTQVVDSSFTADELTKGLRHMGNKIGFIGPGRGGGAPRFVCETPLLGTLVAGICPVDGMEFSEFIDRARNELGLIFGPGTDDNLAEHLDLWEGSGVGGRMLRDNQEALRRRLVRAGLAREYSDGHTEVIYDA